MKPGIPKGTRDFSSTEVAKRNYIFNTIKHSFENFGFQPIETPSFENSSTLMGKYGEEGDRLIFKILNSGDYLSKVKTDFNSFEFFQSTLKGILKKVVKRVRVIKENGEVWKLTTEESKKEDIKRYLSDSLNETTTSFNNNKLFKNLKNDFKNFFKEKNEVLAIIIIDDIEKGIKSNVFFDSNIFDFYIKKVINKDTSLISDKALRYDLTVPFARYVVQHQNEITFPFKRYQIQPVWRADRPQKGRFREFYQCDADVVGSTSLWQEVEFVQLYDTVFSKLGLNGTTIKINNRKILSGIAEVIGASDKLIDFTVALDKLDKIGKDGVVKEMLEKGISAEAIEKVDPLFNFSGSNQDKLASLEAMLQESEEGLQGVADVRTVVDNVESIGLDSASLELDVTLARGLNYYTGAIYEVAAPEGVKMGSIGGGGRYDDLTGIFGLKDVSGVGISFGLDRIYLVMEELGLFEAVELPKPKVLFLNFDENESLDKIKAIKTLRQNNIKSEMYPDVASSNNQQKKQWKYATNREIEFVVTTVENGTLVVKNMSTGEQTTCSLDELINKVQ
ncbi:histidyl-tRNA synthetase [Tenacibaculum mesophilum]|uniref:Histidine--tRNA ligase n=1 Tax=Tenacibaculum mesophilum TaxID=104268 RepID=A0ABM7CEM3_9FLAO|nr:histidine--tRNA ligase [Tenacibaculum mesophilum]AZJ32211.1 histidine--tRNA ligase [Tenacibaculum mesophilum]QFS27466.1 histidine--tRNA ligase [Tenacibaculum mesophilum]SHG17521.1 histidyl-tRNA synthetase [Tenacibaculum mesophilum]